MGYFSEKAVRYILIVLFISVASNLFYAQSVHNAEWSEDRIDDFIAQSELIPIQVTGDKDNRINVVIINQWSSRDKEPYNSPELRGEFVKDIEESLVAALTYGDERAQTAYAHFKDFFNVYGLWNPDVPEWNKGINRSVVEAVRDKMFLPWKNEHTGWVTFLIMPNSDKGGGGAARNLEKRVGSAVIAGNAIGKMLHEISHTCMSLGDEYTTQATGTSAFPTYAADLNYERAKVKWRKWIEPTTPLPTPYEAQYINKVGAFEGNQYHLVDYYRSTAQGCIMGAGVFDNTEEMCPICNQRVSMRAYDLVDIIKSSTPSRKQITINGSEKLSFSVDHLVPEPNTQAVRWLLNGKIIASGVDELEIELGAISEYELVCSITDETPFIRPDPPFARYPKVEVSWHIVNNNPVSSQKPLEVKIKSKRVDKKSGLYNLYADIKGGKPPYTFNWSTTNSGQTIENVGMGVYDLQIIDSEYRTANANIAIYESDLGKGLVNKRATSYKDNAAFTVNAEVIASEVGKNNGSIQLNISGGEEPYTVQWQNANYSYGKEKIYEPTVAKVNLPDYELKTFFSASNNTFLSSRGTEGNITWQVEVANSGIYPVDVIYGGIDLKGSDTKIVINDQRDGHSIHFNQTRPLYTGWDVATQKVYLKEGFNTVSLVSTGQSIPNINYLRVPTSVSLISGAGAERINLSPGDYNYVVSDRSGNVLRGNVTVSEVYPFEISDILFEGNGSAVKIRNPLSGYTYKWYANDVPKTKVESFEKPLATGNTFFPEAKGTYYLSATNTMSGAQSSNRIGFAIGDLKDRRDLEINPSELGFESIKLWLDASDIDGNRKQDETLPQRGPVIHWKDKLRRSPNEVLMKYEPNQLNGKGVAAFDHVWVSILKNEVKKYQTLVMVYKESDMSFAGTSPFREANGLFGKSKATDKSIFDDSISPMTKKGKVYLNGREVDAFATPNPMEFCTLLVELESQSNIPIRKIEGFWEGAIAELIIFDRALEEWERKGVEEYLRRKWFSTVDIEFE